MIKSIIPLIAIILIVVILLLAIPGFVLDVLITLNLVFILFILLNILYSKNIQEISLVPMMLHFSIIINIVITVASVRLILSKKDEIDSQLIGNIYKLISCTGLTEIIIRFFIFLSVLLFFLLFITPKFKKAIEASERISYAKEISIISNLKFLLNIFSLNIGLKINNFIFIISFFLTITSGIMTYSIFEKQLIIDSFILFIPLGYGLGFFYFLNSILLYICVYLAITKYSSDDDIHYFETIKIEAGYELYEIMNNNNELLSEIKLLKNMYNEKTNIQFPDIHIAYNQMVQLDSYEFSIIICAKEVTRKKIKKNGKNINKIVRYADKYIKRNLHEIIKWEEIKSKGIYA